MSGFRLFFFYLIFYSFLGWLLEGFYNLSTKGHFKKPNFLYAPLKPMYGTAAALLIFFKTLLPLWLFLPLCFILPTLVEYAAASLLFYGLDLQYWNYSQHRCQLSGFICLRFSLYWGVLSLVLVYVLQPFNRFLLFYLTPWWPVLFPFFLLGFILDLLLSIRARRCSHTP